MDKNNKPKRIKQLSRHLINQIAAGEVIERPASVVKELVENSIDAGADKIEVEVSNDCLDIRVSDNGCGIEPDDIELAFSKHATSKIETGEDLFNINSLGFRGEALASIISIAKVTCTSRTPANELGTKVECEESNVKKSECGCATGTTMEVKNLFYNTPVRQKFLKSPRVELSYIAEILQSIAIAHPEVSVTLINDSKTSVHTTGSGDLLCTLTEIYSNSIAPELKEINKTDTLSHLHSFGFCSTPNFTRASKKAMYVFVNNRVVKCPVLLKAIDIAYKNLLPSGKYPFVCLNLDLPNTDVDVNVHPTKKEVRYKNPNQIFNFVISSIHDALKAYNSAPAIAQESFFMPSEPASAPVEAVPAKLNPVQRPNFFRPAKDEEEDVVFVSNDAAQNLAAANFEQFSPQKTEPEAQKKIELTIPAAPDAVNFNIIGQYANTYIIFEEDGDLKIVDQHIADERYIFEQLTKNLKDKIPSQLLLISDVLHVEPSEGALLEEHAEKLEQFGYEIQKLSDTEIIFKKVPQVIAHVKVKDILADILANLSGEINNIEEKMLVTMSCKAAVKAGAELNMWQMEELIKKWKTTEKPYTCPHGRPILKTFSEKEIGAFFQRTVL